MVPHLHGKHSQEPDPPALLDSDTYGPESSALGGKAFTGCALCVPLGSLVLTISQAGRSPTLVEFPELLLGRKEHLPTLITILHCCCVRDTSG